VSVSTNGRKRPYLFAGLLGASLLGLALVLLPWVTAGPQPDVAAKRSIPNTDVNPYGANFFLSREVEEWKRERTVSMAAEAGVRWAKIEFSWAEIERHAKATTPEGYDWAKYDAIVDLCDRYGLRVIARVDRAPDWSREDDTVPGRPPDDFRDYGDFIYAFASHYQGRIDYIQVWNEPNLWEEWGARPVDPAGYVGLLEIAYTRAKEANPNVYILSAPLAITLGVAHPEQGKWQAMNDLDYLDAMYAAGAKPYFDILSANAFGMELPPEDPASADALNFSRVILQRQIMERYEDTNKAIWFNEFGWNAAPDSFADEDLKWGRVTEEQQADYALRAIDIARRDWPWAGAFNFWYFRQVGDIAPDQADYYFRVVDVDFTPRRVYYAIKDAATSLTTAGPGYHEETSPGVEWGKGWSNGIYEQASGSAVATADEAGAMLTLTFKGDGVTLVAMRDSRSGVLYVTLDGKAVPGLPQDGDGNSYVDLYAAEVEWQAEIPIVAGLGDGQHVLRLTSSGTHSTASRDMRCAVDAFIVATPAPPSFPFAQSGLFVAVAGLSVWALTVERRRPLTAVPGESAQDHQPAGDDGTEQQHEDGGNEDEDQTKPGV
jgi:polysaccharide biosynthesis protein PslG